MLFRKIRKRLAKRKEDREWFFVTLTSMRNDIVNMAAELDKIEKHLLKSCEGLERNDMAILEEQDGWGNRLSDLIKKGREMPVANKDSVSEAQVKREWFGEEDAV